MVYVGTVPDVPIPFSRPYRAGGELENLEAVLESGHVHGDGRFTRSASDRLRAIIPAPALLTTSCTHALEMASMLVDLSPGDEVILPSFTFASAADAIALSGATPVFVDIDESTGNIDPEAVAAAVTPSTRAISVMHYGGVAVDIPAITAIARRHDLAIIEDNAHGLGATFDGSPLGTWGIVATQSFHDTKNVHSGEGGALILNDSDLIERAEIIREKGTDRSRFLRGQVDKYTWVDAGSSYLMSELNAAVLDAQLEEFENIQRLRHGVWDRYAHDLEDWAARVEARLMQIPPDRHHPAHLFYLLMPTALERDSLLAHLHANGIVATFHYVPLDSSPAGRRLGRTPVPCEASTRFSERLVRLPLWPGMTSGDVDRVIGAVHSFVPEPVSR